MKVMDRQSTTGNDADNPKICLPLSTDIATSLCLTLVSCLRTQPRRMSLALRLVLNFDR